MIKKYEEYLRSNLYINFSYANNFLKVNAFCNNVNEPLYFACYFILGDEVVDKSKYNTKGEFSLLIENTANIVVKIYVMDKNKNIRISKIFKIGVLFVESDYFLKSRKKLINKINKENGKILCEKQILTFPTFDNIEIDLDSIFEINPFESRSWLWKVQQLTHLIYMLNFYDFSLNIEVVNNINNQIEKWHEYSLSKVGRQNKLLWHDHATALRLQNLLFVFNYLLSKDLISTNAKEFNLFLKLFKDHINKLADEEFYSKHTNHGFDQSLILYQATLELRYVLNVEQYIVLAEKRINSEINYAFCTDGGHKENSPAYLNFGIKQCLIAIDIAESYNQKTETIKRIKDIIEIATQALIFTVKPDGYLPLIGDTSQYKVVDIFENFKPKCYGQFKYAITNGKVGSIPKSNTLILEQSGYAIYRSSWERVNFNDAIHLVFKASYHSNYHRHDDDLSFTLYGYGEDWIVDGGIYKYEEKNKHRLYIRSHLSHNLMSPDNFSALRGKDIKHRVGLQSKHKDEKNIFDIHGETQMFDGFRLERNIRIVNTSEICIKDFCSKANKENFDITSRLFFSPDKIISIDRNTVIVKGLKKTLYIKLESESNLDIKHVLVKKDKIKGWLSNINNNIYQSNLIEIKSKNIVDFINIKMNFSFV